MERDQQASVDDFFGRVGDYASLSQAARTAWAALLKPKQYDVDELLVTQGDRTQHVYIVRQGLLMQYHIDDEGERTVKRFFLEQSFAASTSALLTDAASHFSIRAIEPVVVWQYDFAKFKALVREYADIAAFYIAYMERHWIVEKEPLEISFRNDDSRQKYARFRRLYPTLEGRVKQHEIAAFLGITPTQLSRVRAGLR